MISLYIGTSRSTRLRNAAGSFRHHRQADLVVLLLDVGPVEDRGQFLGQPVDDRLRRAGAHVDALERVGLHVLDAGLFQRRHVGQTRPALLRRHGDRAQLAGVDQRLQRADVGGVEVHLAAERRGGSGARAGIGDMLHLDAGADLDQLAGELRRGADAGAGPVHLAVGRLRLLEEFLHRLDRRLRRHHEHVGRGADHHQRHEVLERIVGRRRIEARIDHEGAGADQQGVAVRRHAGDRGGRDVAAGAAAVLDDHRLAERFAERRVDDAGGDVGAAAGREAHHHGDLPVRILRLRGERREQRSECGKDQPAKDHGVLPIVLVAAIMAGGGVAVMRPP